MTREVSYRVLLASVTMTFATTLVAAMVLMRMAVPPTATAARFGHERPELALEAALAAGRPFCYAGRLQH